MSGTCKLAIVWMHVDVRGASGSWLIVNDNGFCVDVVVKEVSQCCWIESYGQYFAKKRGAQAGWLSGWL